MKTNTFFILLILNIFQIHGMDNRDIILDNPDKILGCEICEPNKLVDITKVLVSLLNTIDTQELDTSENIKLPLVNRGGTEILPWERQKTFCNVFKIIFPQSLSITAINLNHLLCGLENNRFSYILKAVSEKINNNYQIGHYYFTLLGVGDSRYNKLINLVNQIQNHNMKKINYHQFVFFKEHNLLNARHLKKKDKNILSLQRDIERLSTVANYIKELREEYTETEEDQ